ncbi:MAG: sigma-70 family RNA polymerase sigma factor [Bacteroidales bacterium]
MQNEITNNNTSKLTDRELIVAAQQGRQEAYTVLLERYRKGLYMFVQEFLSGIKNNDGSIEMAEEPQDICQEAFQKAFQSLDKYNPKYEFSTWIFNIARNIAIDYSRKRKIAIGAKISHENTGEIINILDGVRNSPEEKLISAQEYKKLIKHIDNLNDKYRTIARMRFIKEYAYDEIALELHLQINTVKTRVKRAKEQLMKLINN